MHRDDVTPKAAVERRTALSRIFFDIAAERCHQDNKHGTPPRHRRDVDRYRVDLCDLNNPAFQQAMMDRAQQQGDAAWSDVMLEELAEAFAESDLEKLREELVQVAAVAVAWIEHVERRMK